MATDPMEKRWRCGDDYDILTVDGEEVLDCDGWTHEDIDRIVSDHNRARMWDEMAEIIRVSSDEWPEVYEFIARDHPGLLTRIEKETTDE